MRKFLIAAPLALAAASVLAVPASAAPFSHPAQLRNEITQLDRQVNQAERRHLISSREADRLGRQVNQLQAMHARYAWNGFTNGELRILGNRIELVKKQVAREIRDRDHHRR